MLETFVTCVAAENAQYIEDQHHYFAPNSTKVSEKTIGAGPPGRFNTDGS
jgi:hypothetical protein